MSPIVDRAMMEEVFDAEDLVTLDDEALAGIAHEPTRAFLHQVGLPNRFRTWLELDEPLSEGTVTIVGDKATALAAKYPGLTLDTSTWMTVGGIGYDNVALDVTDGRVYCIPESGALPCLLNSSIQDFAYFLHALEVERPNYDFEAESEDGYFDPDAEDRLLAVMTANDPAALACSDSTWHQVLEHVKHKLQ
ncbi:SUKH-4 family immunity protein [Kitasatospora herbaricolor]|uniref:SUKH-4 family immunity protein n=1 Tax=Kitasatospora herbaricolor TaxID=68217 RepID=A0ABZ1WHH1_9ACTN|nr:SUKH-4 family immunity protein [Kitasatospora herbaricolor]